VQARLLITFVLLIAAFATPACTSGGLLSRFTLAPSPREQYAESLRTANLHLSAMGADWLRAGETALGQPLAVTLPFRESVYFPADRSIAVAYRFELKRGRRFELEVRAESEDGGRLFVDMFEIRTAETAPARVASLSDSSTLTFDVRRDGAYLVRVQPELLRSGRYTLIERTLASLRVFPVEGYTPAAVQSEFGDEREAGRRQHEGIDIVAPRNTPVVAVVDGRATPSTNNLGGNVVWLRDGRAGRSYYYAHLQRWAIEDSTAVTTGQVLGYVGNSGNARATPTHLHFGIYEGGAIDPLPFLGPDDRVPPPSSHADRLAQVVRVSATRASLRAGAERDAPTVTELQREWVATALGAAGPRLRVMLPDGTSGYVDNSALASAASPLRQRRVQTSAPLRDRPTPQAPAITTIEEGTLVQVLGRFHTFELIRTSGGTQGWLNP
jgi:murein DD-endopeptidase MepM/ murein hydrolase activator NlpD